MNIFKNKNKSFTLIELLVVVAIIGLISSIVLVNLGGTREKARITKSLEFSQTVQNVIGAYAVGIWSFESIESGEVLDGSGYGNHGTVYGAILTDGIKINGTTGNALQFDGVNDYVGVPDDASLKQQTVKTITIWLKKLGDEATQAYSYPLRKGSVWNNDTYAIQVMNGDPATTNFFISAPSIASTKTAATSINQGEWTFITGVILADKIQLYKNAVFINETTITELPNNSTALLFISQSGFTFNGIIDEVKIYTQALTTAEIQKHYAEGLEIHKNLAIK